MANATDTLGGFIRSLLDRTQVSNKELAQQAGVSESVISNLVRHGIQPRAKDPDPKTLLSVSDALGVDPLILFRLAGYLPPAPNANSVSAEYVADLFDRLPPEKQESALTGLEALIQNAPDRNIIAELRHIIGSQDLVGFDLAFPATIRMAANKILADFSLMTAEEVDILPLEKEEFLPGKKWTSLPLSARKRILALAKAKLNLEYDPTMVPLEDRG